MIFKKIDEMILKGVESFQESSAHSGLSNLLESLDDEMRKTLGQIGGLAIIFLPLFLCLVLLTVNFYKRSNLEQKEEMLVLAKDYITKKRGVGQSSQQLIGAKDIATKEELLNLIGPVIAPTTEERGDLIAIEGFSQADVTDDIIRIDSQVNFKSLSLGNLMMGIKNISERFRIHIIDIQIEKNEQKKLSGFFNMAYYAEIAARENFQDDE